MMYLWRIRMVRIRMRCVNCPQAGRPSTRYGCQLAIVSPLAMKEMATGHLAYQTVTKTLEIEGVLIRVQLSEIQKLLLQGTSTDGKRYQIIQPTAKYFIKNLFNRWKEFWASLHTSQYQQRILTWAKHGIATFRTIEWPNSEREELLEATR